MTRRGALQLGGAALAGALLERFSLGGAFDHARRLIPKDQDRFERSMEALARDQTMQAGSILHVGHSTHLITIGGVRALTDPWFYDPAFGALRHESAPPTTPASFRDVDLLLLSHDHPDHVDPRALWTFRKVRCLVGAASLLQVTKTAGIADVTLMEPWQSVRVNDTEIVAVPAVHDVPEVGFVLRGRQKSVYYAGDTREGPALAEIRDRLRPTAAVLPVDAMHRKGSPRMTMGPEEAVAAARALGVSLVMPSHVGTQLHDPFARAFLWEKEDDASRHFAALVAQSLPGVSCATPQPGELVPL
jgi:L-ascorbate metabolism protein UlaG (beta-lactamase superfamily)